MQEWCNSIVDALESGISYTNLSMYIFYKHKFINMLLKSMLVHINGLVQERRTSIVNALELCLSCIYPTIWIWDWSLLIIVPADGLLPYSQK